MPQNGLHAQLILLLVWNLRASLRARFPSVWVLTDSYWLAPHDRRIAPDVYVAVDVDRYALGQPYDPRVHGGRTAFVMEILSPSRFNPLDPRHVATLVERYEARGVDEYVEFDMVDGSLRIFDRRGGSWAQVADPWTWASAVTGIRFVGARPEDGLFTLDVVGPGGPFLEPEEAAQAAADATQAAEEATRAAEGATQAAARTADENARRRARLLAAGIDPDSV